MIIFFRIFSKRYTILTIESQENIFSVQMKPGEPYKYVEYCVRAHKSHPSGDVIIKRQTVKTPTENQDAFIEIELRFQILRKRNEPGE